MPELTFLGAARTVTGSKYLLEHDGRRVLVDCGLFQGLKELRLRNWEPFPIAPRSLDAVVVTHAHLDHVGWLPRLVAQGYRGRIFCTSGTADLCRLVLPDSARIQEEDTRRANRRGYTKHHPALPLYTEADAWRAVSQLQPLGYHRPIEAASGLSIEFTPVGHLLGAAYVLARLDGAGTILFGGDLGRYGRPVLPDPSDAVEADIVLVESTYGNRDHAPDDDGEALAQAIRDAAARGGKIIIPSFAIGRVEELLYWVRRLEEARRIPVLPVYIDSPMASEALRFYTARVAELDPDMRPAQKGVATFGSTRFQTVASPQESKALTASDAPAIIISASGMATGGRVLHHMAAALPDPKHTILFVGFQAPGTRGRQLVDGAHEVRIHGRPVPVAARIVNNDSMSAHADRGEILRWLSTLPRPPRRLFLVHGEENALGALKDLVKSRLEWDAYIPSYGERIHL
ncbi:MAG: mRNA 3'-end processing factor [Acidobacteria bacterium RIFCSPLOWO2_12_FULL_67_14]|nr:MAG: mRNA 3'-end processing factor [Acidobacteria bacterium RIFCSPLOWO2_02_FULL_67_21]OFW36554.1 MAG: mRNA 3'-end processing factor [Acidobacteria bacterium RIFCSPLOWO2_12_FULL_67_14]